MKLRDQIKSALKQCKADKEDSTVSLDDDSSLALKTRYSILNLIHAAIMNRDKLASSKDECTGCQETEITNMLRMMESQRLDSIKDYEETGQLDIAEREADELAVIREFLPKKLNHEEARDAVKSIVEDLDANSLKDVSRCMIALNEKYPGRVEESDIADFLKEILLKARKEPSPLE